MFPRAILILSTLLLARPAESSPVFFGFEFGGRYSSFDLVSPPRAGEHDDPLVLPAVGVSVTHPLGTDWSLSPSFRYVLQGHRSSWSDPGLASGAEKILEHSLRGGLEIRYRLPRSVFLSLSPEISYLASATITGDLRVVNQNPVHFEHGYASESDRWNAVVGIGAGTGWNAAGGVATITLRYTRAMNTMSRITPTDVADNQRNIAWTATPIPSTVTEWRLEGVELAMGFSW